MSPESSATRTDHRGNEDARDLLPSPQIAPGKPSVTSGLHIRGAFSLLLEAYRYAEASGRGLWDYAVEIQELKGLGLTINDVRWMICHEWVEHASEVPSPGVNARAFAQANPLSLSPRSCFVLTDLGVQVATQLAPGELEGAGSLLPFVPGSVEQPVCDLLQVAAVREPRWDAERNRLYVGKVLVKEFKLPCPNQGTVLMAFQEENWPARIDDPLPPTGDTDSKTRLSSTIKSLNKNQKRRLIHFMGDGSGEGVIWEFAGTNGHVP